MIFKSKLIFPWSQNEIRLSHLKDLEKKKTEIYKKKKKLTWNQTKIGSLYAQSLDLETKIKQHTESKYYLQVKKK